MEMTARASGRPAKRHYSIQVLRLVFSIMIVNYHFFSLYLRFNDQLPNYFSRGYLADEFFFMVSGFFIAQAAMNEDGVGHEWTVRYAAKRIGKIAVPYYFSWVLCFIGGRVADVMDGKGVQLIPSLLNSVYELTFLEMFGFTKGLYSNSVGWYFSGLLISILLICPLLRRFRKNYVLYAAPALGAFCLGMLSLHYDYLFWPHKVMPEIPILKGMIRAYAEVNLGVFIYGLYRLGLENTFSRRALRLSGWAAWLLWIIIVIYMIVPFESNFDEPAIQYDFIFTFLILIALTITFIVSGKSKKRASGAGFKDALGTASVYIFFGQPILYTLYKWYFGLAIGEVYKFLLFYAIIAACSGLVWLADVLARKIIPGRARDL